MAVDGENNADTRHTNNSARVCRWHRAYSGNSGNTGSNTTPTVTNPTSYTFSGSGWGHSVGMSQWGAYAMAQKGFTYDQILKFYITGIEIAE